MWKAISVIAFVLMLGVGARWVMDGTQVFTKNKQQVVTHDPLFGTETITWEEGFWLGLDLAGPVVLMLVGIGVFGIYRVRKS